MDMEEQVRDAMLADLQRQSELPQSRLRMEAQPDGYVRLQGDVDLEELAMAVVGKVAGGP